MKTKSKQRWLALLMALVVMVGVLPTTAFAGADTQSNERTVETDSFWDSSAENEGHTHSDTCYCEGGELICTLEESEGHTHDENCYDEEGTLTCNLEESEGHIHNEECYCKGGELICGKDERDKDTSDEENLDPDEEKKALEQQDLEQQENTVDLTSGSASYKWFTVKINWVGDEGYEALRGTKVDLTVRNNPTTGSIGTFEAGKNWQREMYLPYEDDDGNLYHYTIDTTNYPLLHAYHIGDTKQEGTTITVDVVFQKTTDIDIDLTWDDFNDATGLRPANAVEAGGYKLCLSGSGEEYEASSVSEITDSKCTVSFKDIPTTYMDADGNLQKVGYGQYGLKLTDSNYYQLPNTVEVKSDSYGNKTLKATAELKVLCKKIDYRIRSYLAPYLNTTSWTAAAQRDIPVPKKIILTLLSDGIAVEGVDAAVFEANEDGTWNSSNAYSHTWYLPLVSADGTDIDYGELSVKVSTDLGDLPKQYTQSPENITFTSARNESVSADLKLLGFEYVMADASWDDDNNQSGARPTTLSVTLLANGEPVGTSQTLTVGSNSRFEPTAWKYRPLLDSEGNRIHYTLQLNDLPAYYTASVTERPAYSEDSGYAWYYSQYLENHFTFTLKKQSASAIVKWEGDRSDSEAMARPDSVVLKLYYTTDGSTWKEFWGNACYAVTQGDDANTWTYKWTALPAVDSEGNPVRYKADQLSPGAAYVTSADNPVYHEDDKGNVSSTDFVFHNSYTDKWNYTINLSWNSGNSAEKYEINKVTTSNDQLTAQYQLTISVQKPYEAGALKIRIPYELFDGRNGKTKGTVPSRFSIGDSSNPSSNYSITYRIDDKGTADTSDDEVIFYNYKDLSASENIQLTVEYTFRPFDVVDCTLGSLTATATGQYTGQSESETQTSGPITYRLDTGVNDFSASKTFCQKVYAWPSEFGEKPDQFDMSQYNYVIYKLGVNSGYLTANQPSYLKFTDSPKDGGKVVAVKEGYINSSLPYSGSQYSIYEGWDSSEASATWQKEYSSYAVNGYYTNVTAYFVMVQYPRTSHEDALNPGQTTYETDYHNEAEFRFVAADEHKGDKGENDKNDVIVKVSDSTVHWTDYKFHYDGDLYSSSKSMNYFSTGALSLLQMGKTQSTSCSVSMTVNGYELSDGYRMDLTDDAVYARATINGKTTEYTRLTEEDYELSGTPGIQITCTDIDRSNGVTIDGQISALPFSLYGRKGNSGEWELLGQFSMTGVNERYKPVSDLTGLGYTALKIQSPGKLQGKYSVTLSGISVSIKSSSPVFSTWLENGDALPSVTVQNLAAYDLYETQKDGSEKWINPYTSTSNSLSSQVGLDELDKMEFGACRHRKNDDSSMYPLAWNSNISKSSNSLEYDPSAETVTVNFKVSEYEGTNTKLDEYPEEICQNGGTFYDLLPLGFVYDTSKGVEVYSYRYSGNTEPYAALEDLTVIDNYKDSGRQLLVVKVKSTREDGKNWSRDNGYGYTGFAFSYYAKASYDDVTSGKTLYNSVAFQRDDLKTISSCKYKEDGITNWSSNQEIWPMDENGKPVFYDINGDGIVTEDKNTLYTCTSFTPSIIQTIQNGLTKRVKGVSGLYHTDDVTGLGETYAYKLRLTAQKSGVTSNVVIYDILEDAANTGGHTGEAKGWKGTFKGVSTRNLKLQGIAPTVWYATASGLSYNDSDNLLIENKPDIWSTTPPDDLSTVTAIAFDLRKASDGSDYVLAADQSVEMEIFMTAPSELQDSEFAYNRPAYNATFRASNVQEGTTSFNISDRTTIALHNLQEFSFIKQYKKNDGSLAPLSGVTFQLYECANEEANHTHTGIPGRSDSCWGKTPVQTVNSKSDGEVKFSELDTGVYAIYESNTPNGFTRVLNQYWVIKVDAQKGTVSVPVRVGPETSSYEMMWNEQTAEKPGYYSLLNERTVRSIRIQKTWIDDSANLVRPTKLTFDLYRNGELYRTEEVTVSSTLNSQNFGTVFTDLYVYDEYGTAYTYKVVERIPEGYTEDKNGEVTVSNTWTDTTVYFTNRRLGMLDVKKLVEGKKTDDSFSFTVTLTDTEGKALDSTTADGNDISFTGRKFTTDASSYTEEALVLTEGGKLTFQLKDGETMRIIGLPVGTKWNASENANVHYTTTVSAGSVSGTASATEKGEVTFTNTVKKGKLTVSKIIAGNNADSNKSFAFTITLDDKNLSGNYGDMEFKDGAANFTLKGGESKTAEGLPSGTAYTVEEADYTGDGYVTTKKGAVGTIVGDDTVEAVFTNTRDKKSEKHHHSSHNDNTTTVTTDTSTTVNPPRTGDTSNAAVWIALILLSMMAIAGIFIRKKRDHQTE